MEQGGPLEGLNTQLAAPQRENNIRVGAKGWIPPRQLSTYWSRREKNATSNDMFRMKENLCADPDRAYDYREHE